MKKSTLFITLFTITLILATGRAISQDRNVVLDASILDAWRSSKQHYFRMRCSTYQPNFVGDDLNNGVKFTSAQGNQCAMLVMNTSQKQRTDHAYVTNSKYTAALERTHESDSWRMVDLVFAYDSLLRLAGNHVSVMVYANVAPNYVVHDLKHILDAIEDNTIEIQSIKSAKSDIHENFVELHYRYSKPNTDGFYRGHIILDGKAKWCISQRIDEYKNGGVSGATRVKYTYDIDAATGFPITRRVEYALSESGIGGFDASKPSNTEFSVTEGNCTESECTLSAFGLPEPVGVEWERPTPWYLYFAAGVALFVTATALFRWLSRRRAAPKPA